MHFVFTAGFALGISMAAGAPSLADDMPAAEAPPAYTLSPDHRYGITVPAAADDSSSENNLVETGTGTVVGVINAETAFAHMGHGRIFSVWWLADDSYLLWQVDGKWSMATQILVCLKEGKVAWELDVLSALQRAILTRTEAADPKKFLAAKKEHWGDGSAYPEKFAIDAVAQNANAGPLTFPVRFEVFLTSNPKGNEGEISVDSRLEATLSRDGLIEVTEFHLGKAPKARLW